MCRQQGVASVAQPAFFPCSAQRPFPRVPERFSGNLRAAGSPKIDDLGFPRGSKAGQNATVRRSAGSRALAAHETNWRPQRRAAARDAPVDTVAGGARRSVSRRHRRAGLATLTWVSQHTPCGHKEADEGLRPLDPQTVCAEARKDRGRRVRRDG